MNRTIYLDYNIARIQNLIVDREQFIKKYDIEDKYQLTQGAPILINVDGSYVNSNDLLNLCKPYQKMTVNKWLIGLKHPTESLNYLEFKWRRD